MPLNEIYTNDDVTSGNINIIYGQAFNKFRQNMIKRFDVVYDGSYWCDPTNGIVNAEWTLKDEFNYFGIFDDSLFKNDFQHILNFRVLPHNYPYGKKDTDLSGPQQVHMHLSKKNFDFRNARVHKEYFRYLNLIWVSEYQQTNSSLSCLHQV